MLKKLTRWDTTQTALFLSILCLGFVFSFLFGANCNSGGNKTPADSAYSSTTAPSDPGRLNWLNDPGWDSLLINVDTSDAKRLEFAKRKIRAYVRGWADEYNIDSGTHYRVAEFEFIPKSTARRYAVKAYLVPPARLADSTHDHHDGSGTHLIPNEPPPPE